MVKSISELEQKYNLELDKIIKNILKLKENSKILLQFPDGLKPYATLIAEYLEQETKTKKPRISIWLGSCFGACDTPQSDADLLIQFGHAPWK